MKRLGGLTRSEIAKRGYRKGRLIGLGGIATVVCSGTRLRRPGLEQGLVCVRGIPDGVVHAQEDRAQHQEEPGEVRDDEVDDDRAVVDRQGLLKEAERIGNLGGWEVDIDTGQQTWTEQVYHIHEVDLSFVPTAERGVSFYTPECRPVIERAVRRAIEQGEPFDLDLEIITARGNRRYVHAIGYRDQENRRIFGFFQDISERKRVEHLLSQSEQRYQTLVENVPIGVFRCTLCQQGSLLMANRAFLAMCGLDEAEIESAAMTSLLAAPAAWAAL